MTKLMEQVVAELEKLPEERQVELAALLHKILQEEIKGRKEKEEWSAFSLQALARAYSDDEPEYTDADILNEERPRG
jgi:hypothetical protein